MNAASSSTFEAGRLATGLATAEPAAGPRGRLALEHGGASSGDLRARCTRHVETVLASIERVVVRALHGLRDARDRRCTVRELRRLSPALLADIGIEPEDIEQMVGASLASQRHRHRAAMRNPESRTRRREARDGLR
ncbi:MAG: DUF1127 domain-containing protein [Immundisolibacterales bacterium]|nr:DUF1127 domain-containing protein [Immundisolibacterales bacterium]